MAKNTTKKSASPASAHLDERRRAFLRTTDPMLAAPAMTTPDDSVPRGAGAPEPMRGRTVGSNARYIKVEDLVPDSGNPRTLIAPDIALQMRDSRMPTRKVLEAMAGRDGVGLNALTEFLTVWVRDANNPDVAHDADAPDRTDEASKFGVLGSVCELAVSISRHGVLQAPAGEPMLDGRVSVVDGHRRMVALLLLNLIGHPHGNETIVTLQEPRTEIARLLAQHTANQSRESLAAADVFELILKVQKLIEHGSGKPVSMRAVARALNLRQDLVARLQVLARLSEPARRSIASGGLAAGLISETIGRAEPGLQTRMLAMLERAAEQGVIDADKFDEVLIQSALGAEGRKFPPPTLSETTRQARSAAVAAIRAGIRDARQMKDAVERASALLGDGGKQGRAQGKSGSTQEERLAGLTQRLINLLDGMKRDKTGVSAETRRLLQRAGRAIRQVAE
jgi:ParB-like chromosome segregation protein Spo0J